MKPEDSKYVLENIGKKSIKEIAEDLHIKEKWIRKFLNDRKVGSCEAKEKPSEAPAASFFHKPIVFNLCLSLVLAIGIFIRIDSLGITKHAPLGDENFYLGYARYMAEEKGASVKALIANYIEKDEWHVYPTPIRTGHILLSSFWMRMMNRFDNVALLYMSCFFSILSLFLGYLFAKRLFGEKIALLSLILFAASPLSLALSKRILQDPDVYFFIILALYAFYEMVKSKNVFLKLSFIAAFIASFYISIMLKETSIMLAGFFFIFIIVEKMFFDKELKILPAISAVILALAAALATYISLTGGVGKLIQLVKVILLTPKTNPYVIQFQGGTFFRYIHDFFLLSPATLILALVFLFLYVTVRPFRSEPCGYLVVFFISFYTMLSMFNKNVRAVFPLDFPIRVFSSIVIYHAAAKLGRKRDAAALALIIGIAMIDIAIFNYMFVTHDVYDPVTYNLQFVWQTLLPK